MLLSSNVVTHKMMRFSTGARIHTVLGCITFDPTMQVYTISHVMHSHKRRERKLSPYMYIYMRAEAPRSMRWGFSASLMNRRRKTTAKWTNHSVTHYMRDVWEDRFYIPTDTLPIFNYHFDFLSFFVRATGAHFFLLLFKCWNGNARFCNVSLKIISFFSVAILKITTENNCCCLSLMHFSLNV